MRCRYLYFSYLMSLVFVIYVADLKAEPLKVSVDASSALLINAETGQVLYEKNSDKQYFPASTTKIATALFALKKKKDFLGDKVTAQQDSIGSILSAEKVRSNYTLPAYWIEKGSSHIGIKRGEIFCLEDLFYGMMIASGNDAANVIAQDVSGSVPKFMEGLNTYLQEMGCKKTVFYNPHGLHHPKHLTTAEDLALIAREAMKEPFFRKLVSTVRYTRPETNKQESSVFVQTNQIIRPNSRYYYPKAIGIKTGYTGEAGYALVAAARDGERTLIAVLLKCSERGDSFEGAKKLFESAFNQRKLRRVLLNKGIQELTTQVEGASTPLVTYLDRDVFVEYYLAEEPDIRANVFWKNLKSPIEKGECVGEIRLASQNTSFEQTVYLYAAEDVQSSLWFFIREMWGAYRTIFLGAVFVSVAMLFILQLLRKRKT